GGHREPSESQPVADEDAALLDGHRDLDARTDGGELDRGQARGRHVEWYRGRAGRDREEARRKGGRLGVPGYNHCVGARRRGGGERERALGSAAALDETRAERDRVGAAAGAGIVEDEIP